MQGPYLRKYGVETTVDFVLFETDGINLKTDAAHAAGDTKVMKDEGAEANTANAFTDEGQGYSIVLSATEMEAARIVVYVVDAATKVWLDTAFTVETYGNASAMHAFDLDTATVNLSSATETQIDNIEGDTNELQTDDVPGLIAALNDLSAADVNAEVDTALGDYDPPTRAELTTDKNSIITEVDANETKIDTVDTNVDTLITRLTAARAGYLDELAAANIPSDLDAVLADTNELQTDDVPGLVAALNDIAVTDVTQRQIPDSVPADGTRPTIEQALYMIVQYLYERAVSDTTVTVKKVDGSTSLLTLTLDDASDPTSITRAT